MSHEPVLTAATLIHHLVSDLLYQNGLDRTEFPEIIDLATIGTGTGNLRSQLQFVSQGGAFWDSTRWAASPRPFLDSKALAYTCAVAAWIRDEKDPSLAREIPNEIKRSVQKSLKHLLKTGDSFFPTINRKSAFVGAISVRLDPNGFPRPR